MKYILKYVIVSLWLFTQFVSSQTFNNKDTVTVYKTPKFKVKSLILPSALIVYGVVGLESDNLKLFNSIIKNEVEEDIDQKFSIDDFSQYTPAFSVYAINLFGVKGKNNFKDRSIILATSYLLVGSSVYTLKNTTKIERPDHSAFNSFPSGHTANAFSGAEFLWQEYKDVSVWYGISGYLVATGTGIFRIVNDRHWLTDVAAGAGIGILSTKIAYWIFPYIDKHIFKNKSSSNTAMFAPFYNGKQLGATMVLNFK